MKFTAYERELLEKTARNLEAIREDIAALIREIHAPKDAAPLGDKIADQREPEDSGGKGGHGIGNLT